MALTYWFVVWLVEREYEMLWLAGFKPGSFSLDYSKKRKTIHRVVQRLRVQLTKGELKWSWKAVGARNSFQVVNKQLESFWKCRSGRWKLLGGSIGGKRRDRSKTENDTKVYSMPMDNIKNQCNSILSLSSSWSRLIPNGFDDNDKVALHEKNLLRQNIFNILLLENLIKLKKSTFKFFKRCQVRGTR